MTDLTAALQTELDAGTLGVTGLVAMTVQIPDVSTASSVIVPVIGNMTFVRGRVVLGGAITVADANVAFTNAAGGSMGSAVVVPFTGSAKGAGFSFTATANNVLTGPTWIEVATDGGSTGTVPLYITLEFEAKLN